MHTGLVIGQEGLDLASVQAEEVRYGVEVGLPFRIRTGELTKVQIDEAAEVWFLNSVAIPRGTEFQKVNFKPVEGKGYTPLWTRAVVILSNLKLVPEALEELRAGKNTKIVLGGNSFRALTALNECVYGYSEALGSMVGGAPLRFLTQSEFFQAARIEFTFIARREYAITSSDVKEVFDWKPSREIVFFGQIHGQLDDVEQKVFEDIPKKIEQLRQHAYHELAFRAKMAMFDHEPVIALVLACAALEGAHAALLRKVLVPQLPENADGLVEQLLREQGIHTLVQISPYTFLETSKRPSAEAIANCAKALTIRNDILHAKQKKGIYKLRSHTAEEINKAYSAVLSVYKTLADAVA